MAAIGEQAERHLDEVADHGRDGEERPDLAVGQVEVGAELREGSTEGGTSQLVEQLDDEQHGDEPGRAQDAGHEELLLQIGRQ
ncbi:MAG: hypothetical protein ABL966_11110 [Acidimicrobiales bacterium]